MKKLFATFVVAAMLALPTPARAASPGSNALYAGLGALVGFGLGYLIFHKPGDDEDDSGNEAPPIEDAVKQSALDEFDTLPGNEQAISRPVIGTQFQFVF